MRQRIFRWSRRTTRQILEDVVAALFPASCLHCDAPLEETPLPVAPEHQCWSPLWTGQLRRDFLPGFRVPLRLLCPNCCATLMLAGPSALQVPGCRIACVAAFEPSPVLFRLIHALKYQSCREVSVLLGAILAKAARQQGCHNGSAALVPVPLHPNRQRSRGFNQSQLLAEEVGRRLGIPIFAGVLQRRHDTLALAQLAAPERWRQVAGAFVCKRGLPPPPARLWLLDDVVTSGSTVQAVQQALRANNREIAGVITLCRAHSPSYPATGLL